VGCLIHIVDDDELFRATASYLLSRNGYSTQIYSSGAEFFRSADLARGCILLDIKMPRMNGYEVQEELARMRNMLPVVVTSAYGDAPAIVRAMKLGAADFIVKPASEDDLLAVLGRVTAALGHGERRRDATAAAVMRLKSLTPRERQILQGLLDGLPNKGIARRLGISPRTVEVHRANMKAELGITTTSEAVQFAIDAELTPVRPQGINAAA
jgi:two-component system response regulator FixJ